MKFNDIMLFLFEFLFFWHVSFIYITFLCPFLLSFHPKKKNKYMTKICCFFNYPPHYRYAIYKAIDNTFDCDFYFGDDVFQPLKTFDVHRLHGFKSFLKAKMTNIKGYIWHKG